jgi:hypothetical protein
VTVYNGQAVYRVVICRYKGLAQYFGGPTVKTIIFLIVFLLICIIFNLVFLDSYLLSIVCGEA